MKEQMKHISNDNNGAMTAIINRALFLELWPKGEKEQIHV
jgi:hypothetical protein